MRFVPDIFQTLEFSLGVVREAELALAIQMKFETNNNSREKHSGKNHSL